MLVLTRKDQEHVNLFIAGRKLGEVYFLGINEHGRAKLGFNFGNEIQIERSELTEHRESLTIED